MVNEHAALSPDMNQLLALFAAELAEVRFGDLDHDALMAAASAVDAAAATLAEAERTAVAARAALDRVQGVLLLKGQRALAHARIHAEGDAALTERLQGIVLDRASERASDREAAAGFVATAMRRRGRPPKSAALGEVTGTLRLDDAVSASTSGPAASLDDEPVSASA
jgi:hypothetical protein